MQFATITVTKNTRSLRDCTPGKKYEALVLFPGETTPDRLLGVKVTEMGAAIIDDIGEFVFAHFKDGQRYTIEYKGNKSV